MTFAVVGKDVTVTGFTLQLLLPEISEQVRPTIPVKPVVAVTLIGPLVVLLPAFTVGKEVASLSMKSGLLLRTCRTALTSCVVLFTSEPVPCTLK